jgi:hypothetical protein
MNAAAKLFWSADPESPRQSSFVVTAGSVALTRTCLKEAQRHRAGRRNPTGVGLIGRVSETCLQADVASPKSLADVAKCLIPVEPSAR